MPRKGFLPTILLSALMTATAATPEESRLFDVLRKQGVAVLGPIAAQGGLNAWAAESDGRPIAIYQAPDRKHVVIGTMLDMAGREAGKSDVVAAVRVSLSNAVMEQLASTTWIGEGRADAPRIVYVFTDLNCESCFKFWLDARPWVDSGKVRLRHILVGLRGPESAGRAAEVLTAADPSSVFLKRVDECAMKAAHPHLPWAFRCEMPTASATEVVQHQMDGNMRVLRQFGFNQLPALVWIDQHGELRKQIGVPEDTLMSIFEQ
ncbi:MULTISPECIES: thiol:disulfide interchange protein DsbG [Cupriavidus]|uniref:Thiol:disulfide interchange protein DsbG n=1 Tax=Cupriavidus campinensis TaxID=151783 RepID=A0AAE9I584_9BURK|nr:MULTISPECIES: thiol:disulfide interchange protein DsbG [Cupriavidus]MCM3606153.1 thiol:disulfide interchange protein DsbG [Cupriavidus pauculus]MDT6961235.1 thiol:disulfide interchange protein DsbG [Cupriavidus sp. SZY C1]MWL90021.1 thiol:disulfide interchange protein DsbG [Cupriavidus sp. SW-Y-13]TSP12024.1 thiol:disulfide interchange protein DsbG [Cupriavidus campinensis]URF06322.1 thiol:disulfide interchange protein DsbG [Cupriavidus campinensis]